MPPIIGEKKENHQTARLEYISTAPLLSCSSTPLFSSNSMGANIILNTIVQQA